jgi:hypothetical protein
VISLSVNGLKHRPNPFAEAVLRRLRRLTIDPDCRAAGNPHQIPAHPVRRDVMSQRREAECWLASGFRCYSLEVRFHGQSDPLFV